MVANNFIAINQKFEWLILGHLFDFLPTPLIGTNPRANNKTSFVYLHSGWNR